MIPYVAPETLVVSLMEQSPILDSSLEIWDWEDDDDTLDIWE